MTRLKGPYQEKNQIREGKIWRLYEVGIEEVDMYSSGHPINRCNYI